MLMEAQRFFEVAVPQMVSKHLESFLDARGSIAFSIHGEGQWTIQLGDIDSPVVDEFVADADLRLWLSPEAFEEFITGDLDGVEALINGDLVVAGNTLLLETVGYLLKPTTSLLDIYMNQ